MKMPLDSLIKTYQILTNDDEVCIPCFFSILIAVRYLQSTATAIRQMSCGLQPKYLVWNHKTGLLFVVMRTERAMTHIVVSHCYFSKKSVILKEYALSNCFAFQSFYIFIGTQNKKRENSSLLIIFWDKPVYPFR